MGRLTRIITPNNTRLPGTVPTADGDYVTSFTYDNLQSPTQPIKVTDPQGYQTIYKYDGLARLEETLRQYAIMGDGGLYSGTTYGFNADSGLPDTITVTRDPLDSGGAAIDTNATSDSLISTVSYDLLDRPNDSVFAKNTDKEIHTRMSYTSTGIRYKSEVWDPGTDDNTSPHWNASETACDGLSRPIHQTLPEVNDASTTNDIIAGPSTDIIYNAYGQVEKVSDAYHNETTFRYDLLGRLAYRKSPPVLDAKSSQIQSPVTIYHYDAVGQLVRMVDPRG